MKKYEILEHPAELRIRVFGKTKEELFQNAAEAMAGILASSNQRQKARVKEEKIKIESADLNTLLVDFLNEILAKGQINKCVYKIADCKLQIAKNKEVGITAELAGFPIDRFDEDIKAVTHQDVDIRFIAQDSLPKTKLWQTIIVFDI